jgi:predicted Rossmann fold nucleotide-binding protein DprA/Smf involved in DNA uptake
MKIAIIGTRNMENSKEVLANITNYLTINQIDVKIVRSGNALGTDQLANKFAKIEGVDVFHYLP